MGTVCRAGNTSTSGRPITFNVSTKNVKGKTYYEAVALLNGFTTTKLKRVDSECTLFATTQAIVSACKARANEYNRSAKIVMPVAKTTNKSKKKVNS
jgi:hypothetical protein